MMQEPQLRPFIPMIKPMLGKADEGQMIESLNKVKKLIDFVIFGGINPLDN